MLKPASAQPCPHCWRFAGVEEDGSTEGQEWVCVAGFALHVAVDDLELLSRSCQYATDQCAL
jgi:hypothetical protein